MKCSKKQTPKTVHYWFASYCDKNHYTKSEVDTVARVVAEVKTEA